ncbi:phosphoribosylglycinamide formyltransferase [Candidatus Uhrbacteria bacterium]|nr:MAG: phosphoribosylglycinamide formyltransferase [Candidatus Uhrbacteria bacterium]
MTQNPLRLALLISGGGTTMSAILNAWRNGPLTGKIDPVLVISSNPEAAGLRKAVDGGVACRNVMTIRPRAFPNDYGDVLLEKCRRHGVNFIGQYGWLPLTPANVVEAFHDRIVNQHPGPLDPGYPDFGGKGMYGRRVHAARLLFSRMTHAKREEQWTEVVAHRVTPEFDLGNVVHAERVPILPKDTVEDLQQRALEVEWRVQIEALRRFADGEAQDRIRETRLVPPHQRASLEIAKQMAQILYPKG